MSLGGIAVRVLFAVFLTTAAIGASAAANTGERSLEGDATPAIVERKTFNRTPATPGSIEMAVTYRIPETVSGLEVSLPFVGHPAVAVTATRGFTRTDTGQFE